MRIYFIILCILGFLSGCNKAGLSELSENKGTTPQDTGKTLSLIKYGGDLQTLALSSSSSALNVRVLDENLSPVSNEIISFSVISGAGSLSSAIGLTDAQGMASVTYTAPGSIETATIEARTSFAILIFSLQVVVPTGTSTLIKYGGDYQSLSLSSTSSGLTIKAIDGSLNPIQGETIQYTVVSGAGTLSSASATTNAQGVAGVTYSASNVTESVTIEARSSFGIVTFSLQVGSSGPNGYPALSFNGIVSAETLSSSQVKVRFMPANGGSGLYTYRIYKDSNFSVPFRTFSSSQIQDEGTFYAYTISGLTGSTSYDFSVRVYDALISSEDSNVVESTVTTLPTISGFTGISTIDNITTTTLRVNWSSHVSASNYKIYRINGGNQIFVATVPAPATSYTVTGLSASTSYVFRVLYENNDGYADSNTNDISATTLSPLAFVGVTGTSLITSNFVRLHWTHISGAQIYKVFNMTSGTPVQIASVSAPQAYYDVSGLGTGSTSIFRVRAQNSEGIEDSNTATVTVTTPVLTVAHMGWTDAYATGPRVDISAATTEPGALKIKWRPSSPTGGAISGYNIYRSTEKSGVYTKINSSPITGIVNEDLVYQETVANLTAGKAYYYKISAMISGVEYFHEATSPVDHTVIRIIYPLSNVGFVHRWIANQDLCDEIGRGLDDIGGSDVANNYRCPYNGLASTLVSGARYYDLGNDLLVDLHETGCNFSRNACKAHTVGATTNVTDCVGLAAPDGAIQAAQNSIFYLKNTQGICYIQTSANPAAPNWLPVSSLVTGTDIAYTGNNLGSYFYGNKVSLPPLQAITQDKAWEVCQTQTASYSLEGVSYIYRKRLLKNKEWNAAAQWSPTMNAVTMAQISSGSVANDCISEDGIDSNYNPTSARWPTNQWYDYTQVTGTLKTSNCRSRYGLSEMVNNASEFVAEQFYCSISGNINCNFATTPINNYANALSDWVNGDGSYYSTMSTTTNAWSNFYYGNGEYTATDATNGKFLNPMIGLIMSCNGTSCAGGAGRDDNTLVSGLTSGATLNNYRQPYASQFSFRYDFGYPGSMYATMLKGGGGGGASEFDTHFYPLSGSGGSVGLRCAFPVSH